MEPNTVKELGRAVGERVVVQFQSVSVICTVVDAKNSWGRVRLLVRPVAGYGEQWVELERLTREDAGHSVANSEVGITPRGWDNV